MILVDTNAWVAFVRKAEPKLRTMLLQSRVVTCDVVLGELQLGSGLPATLARELALLPRVPSPSAGRTRDFIERQARVFQGAGVGWADAQIVVAAVDAGARLHTSDQGVQKVWRRLGFQLA